jgi:hypothetical protein
LPLFLAAVLSGTLASAGGGAGLDRGFVWLVLAALGSVSLHLLVVRDGNPDPVAGRRTTLAFPLAIAALLCTGALASPASTTAVTLRSVTNVVLIAFLLWHVYHVLMQKYGILRIYSAKSGHVEKVPGWVDRLLVWCIVPVVFVWVGGGAVDGIASRLAYESAGLDGLAAPFLRMLGAHFGTRIALSSGLIAAAVGAFLYYEWRVHRLRNTPRLAYAAGTLLFYTTFFGLGLGTFYSCFAFAHGIEYMVFIWAFQRRRYAAGTGAGSAQARSLVHMLKRPLVFYVGYTGALAAFLFYCRYGERFTWIHSESVRVFGETPWEWIRWYTVYQGILHFYYDGFLWKMRRPELRAQM